MQKMRVLHQQQHYHNKIKSFKHTFVADQRLQLVCVGVSADSQYLPAA
jgi:hypothetical protein